MTLDKDTARAALDDLESTADRAKAFAGYRQSGPIFAAWGAAWLGGNLAHYYDLPQPDLIFGGLLLAAVVISIVFGVAGPRARVTPAFRRKSTLSGMALGLSVFGFFLLLAPVDHLLTNALISYLAAAIYTYAGIWLGARIAWLGMVLMAIILAGWYGAREHFELIMGLGGGGVLLLTGLWLWRQ